MSEPPSRSTRGTDPGRVTTSWRVAAAGAGAGLLAAVLTGAFGGSGRTGMAVLLLVTALGCAAAALYAVVTLLYDELRGRDTTLRRAAIAAGLFLLTAVLMAMVAGIGG